MNYILLMILWIIFYALHSILADNRVKSWAQKILKSNYRFYRLAFNLMSILFLAPIIYYHFSLPQNKFLSEYVLLKISGVIVLLAGLIILMVSFASFNLKEFFGIEQIKNPVSTVSEKTTHQKLITKGLYAYVRHPLYFGIILMIVGVLILIPTYAILVFATVTFIYLPVGVKLEENKLIEEFGEQYRQYQREVKMLIPYLV